MSRSNTMPQSALGTINKPDFSGCESCPFFVPGSECPAFEVAKDFDKVSTVMRGLKESAWSQNSLDRRIAAESFVAMGRQALAEGVANLPGADTTTVAISKELAACPGAVKVGVLGRREFDPLNPSAIVESTWANVRQVSPFVAIKIHDKTTGNYFGEQVVAEDLSKIDKLSFGALESAQAVLNRVQRACAGSS